MQEKNAIVNIKVDIDPEGFKQLVEKGKLVAFVDTLPVMLAGAIKAKCIEKLAAGGLAGAHTVAYYDDDFWPPIGPDGPWPWAEVGIPAVTMLFRKVQYK